MGKKRSLGELADSLIAEEEKPSLASIADGLMEGPQTPPTDPFASAPSSAAFGGGGAASAGIPRPAATASPSMQGGGAPPSGSGRKPFKGLEEAPDRQPELLATQALDARPKAPLWKGNKPLTANERKNAEQMLNLYQRDFSPGVMDEKKRLREMLALDDDIKARPERHDPNHPDYARVHGRDAYYDAFFSDMDEAGVQKNKARIEQEVAALKKEGDALTTESVILGQIESDIQRTPEGPDRNAFINEYNTLFSKAESRQKAMEDMARSIDRDDELLTRRNLEIQRGKGSWGGALWNSTVEGMGKMNRAVFGDLLPDIYVEFQDDERIKALGGKDKFKREMKAILSEDIMGEEGFGGTKAKGTTQEYIDRIKKEHPILGGGILGLAESVPAMATPMMSGIFLQVADGLNEEMKGEEWDGVNEWEKKGMAYLGGAVGMTLERFGFKNLVNNSAATKQIIARVIEKLPTNATPGQIQRVLDAETASWAKNYAIRAVGGFAAEAETGAAQEIMDVAMKEVYNLAKSKQLFDTPESVGEFAKDVLVAGVQEGVGGKIMAVPSALSSAMSTKGRIKAMEDGQYEFLEGLLKDPDFQATWDAKAQDDVKKGRMPKAEYEKALDDWGVAQSVAEQIPEGLPADKRREAFDILLEKQKLKGKDKTLAATRMAALDERLAALVGQPTKEEAKAAPKEEAPAKEPEAATPPPIEEAVIEPPLPIRIEGTPLEGIVGGRAVFARGDERIEGDVYLDGRTVVIETPERVYEVGNVDDLSSMTAEDMPLSVVPETISVTEDGGFVYAGADPDIAKGVIVPQGAGLKAIKRGKDGGIKRIVVTDADGNTKNIRGQEAEDLAYRMMLRAVENNQSALTKDDSITEEIDAEHARQTEAASTAKADAPSEKGAGKRDGGGRRAATEKGQVAAAAVLPDSPVRLEGAPETTKPNKKEDERAITREPSGDVSIQPKVPVGGTQIAPAPAKAAPGIPVQEPGSGDGVATPYITKGGKPYGNFEVRYDASDGTFDVKMRGKIKDTWSKLPIKQAKKEKKRAENAAAAAMRAAEREYAEAFGVERKRGLNAIEKNKEREKRLHTKALKVTDEENGAIGIVLGALSGGKRVSRESVRDYLGWGGGRNEGANADYRKTEEEKSAEWALTTGGMSLSDLAHQLYENAPKDQNGDPLTGFDTADFEQAIAQVISGYKDRASAEAAYEAHLDATIEAVLTEEQRLEEYHKGLLAGMDETDASAEDVDTAIAQAEDEFFADKPTDEEADEIFGSRTKPVADGTKEGKLIPKGVGDRETSRRDIEGDAGAPKREQDEERAILEENLAGARKELETYERYFKKQAESLFDKGAIPTKNKRAEPSMFEAEGDTRANSAEDMEAGAKTLRDRVALAEKALADYDNKTVPAKKQAAAAQTTIPEAGPSSKSIEDAHKFYDDKIAEAQSEYDKAQAKRKAYIEQNGYPSGADAAFDKLVVATRSAEDALDDLKKRKGYLLPLPQAAAQQTSIDQAPAKKKETAAERRYRELLEAEREKKEAKRIANKKADEEENAQFRKDESDILFAAGTIPVDEILTMHSPHEGADRKVSYRGPVGNDKSMVVIVGSGHQMAVPNAWLRGGEDFAKREAEAIQQQKEIDDQLKFERKNEFEQKRADELQNAPTYQTRNGWEIVRHGVLYHIRDPHTKEVWYNSGSLKRVREVADETQVEAPAKAEAPLPKKKEEPAKPPTGWKRSDPKSVEKSAVLKDYPATKTTPAAKEYAIKGFEEYPVVVVKGDKGWQPILRVGDFEIPLGKGGHPTDGLAAFDAGEIMGKAGKAKIDAAVERAVAAQGMKDGGVSEQRPFRTDDADAIGFNYTTDAIARERFDIPSLEKIGSGSDRDVYDLGNGKVLKIAKTARGLEQNMYEGQNIDFLPDAHERGMNYVVVDKVAPAKASDVIEYEGYDGGAVGTTTIGEMLKELSKFSQKDADNHSSAFQDAVNRYGFNDVMNYNILWNDFIAKRNWGVKDGMAIHLDGGTFGGVRMIDDFRGKKNLDDADFREIYNRSRAAKKQFGDKDKATMYQRPTDSAPIKTGRPRLDRVLNAMKGIAPGLNIIVHDTKEAYSAAVAKEGEGLDSSWGVYAPSSNTIHVSPASPDLKQTLFHETAHPIILALARNNPDRLVDFVHEVRNHPDGKRYNRFASRYRDLSVEQQMNEVLAEFLGDVVSGKVKVSTKPDSLYQRFKDFIKDILAALGWDMRTIDLSKPDNIREFAAQFKKAMDKGIRITGLAPVEGGGISLQRPRTTKASEWNAAVDAAADLNNLLSKGEERSILDAADLITDPDGKAEFIRLMNEQMGVTKPPLGTKANQKKVSKAFLRDELNKAVEAGKRAGIADVAKARKEFVAQVKEALSKDKLKGSLSDAQARSIAARAAAVNPLNPKDVDRFIDYAEKVVAKANYAADLEAAESAKAKLRSAAKRPRIPVNIAEAMRDMSQVDVELLSDPLKYASMAEALLAAASPVKGGKYAMADIDAITDYLASIESEWLRSYGARLAEDFGISEMDGLNAQDIIDAIEGGELDAFAENLEQAKRAALKARMVRAADYTRMGLRDTDASWMQPDQKRLFDSMLNADLSMLTPQQIADYIFAADNIIINRSTDGTGAVQAALDGGSIAQKTGAVTSKHAIRTDWPTFGFKLGDRAISARDAWRDMMHAVPNAMARLAGFTRAMGDLTSAIGIADIIMAKTKVDKEVRQMADGLERFLLHQAAKAKRNGRNLDSADSRYMEGIVGLVMQGRKGRSEQRAFEMHKALIEQDIEKNADSSPKEYVIIQRLYDKYVKDATSIGDVLKAFKKDFPENAAVLDYLIKMGARRADEVLRFERSFRNHAEPRLDNWIPIRFVPRKATPSDAKDAFGADFDGSRGFARLDKSLSKPMQSANLKQRAAEARLPEWGRIDYNARRNTMQAISRNLFDARVSPRWAAVRAMLMRSDAKEVLGGEQNVVYLTDMLADLYEAQIGLGLLDKKFGGEIMDAIASGIKGLSARIGLAGMTQIIQQPSDQLTNAYIMSSAGPGDFIRSMRDVLNARDNGLGELLSMGAIGERGELLAGTKWSSALDAEMSRLSKIVETGAGSAVASYLEGMNRKWFKPLAIGDVISASTAWVQFYKKHMAASETPMRTWHGEKEALDGGDEARKAAFAYAEMMTNLTQGPSDPAMFAKWARRSRSGFVNLFRVINNPFGSFPASMRARLEQAASEMRRYRGVADNDPSKASERERFDEAARVMAATSASSAAFEATKMLITRPLIALMAAGIGKGIQGIVGAFGDDDDEKENLTETLLSMTAAVGHLLHLGAIIDRDMANVFSEADRQYRERRRMGLSYDEETAARKKRGEAIKVAIANYITSMTVSGTLSAMDDSVIDNINRMWYWSELLDDAPSVVSPSGKVKKFDDWLKDTENTPLVRYGQGRQDNDWGAASVIRNKFERMFDAAAHSVTTKAAREEMTATRMSYESLKVLKEDSRALRGFVKRMKESKTEAQRRAVASSFDEWLASRDKDPKKRQALGKAFMDSLKDAEKDPWLYIVKGISDSKYRAAAILSKMEGMSTEEQAMLGAQMRQEGILTPMVAMQMARLQAEERAEPAK